MKTFLLKLEAVFAQIQVCLHYLLVLILISFPVLDSVLDSSPCSHSGAAHVYNLNQWNQFIMDTSAQLIPTPLFIALYCLHTNRGDNDKDTDDKLQEGLIYYFISLSKHLK